MSLLCLVACAFAGDRFVGPGFHQARLGGAPGLAVDSASADESYSAQPYNFGYDTVDEYGNKQFHKEQGDANNAKTGSFGYRDANGVYRRVNYVADANGFRATVETNEPGTKAGVSADAVFDARSVVVTPSLSKAAAYGAPVYAKPAGRAYGHRGHDEAAYDQARYGHQHPGYRHHGYGNRA
ncbi:cuticle protein, putative [Ixodes scapularis]|uniref:Cuticle protein, putative n=1 Tax=Ixodes scapularis TaxID=6945 RepID=B7QAH4_IXOSC|nr:cuticle protein, putative [Ixodes scapularis]|eukprot:XP_002412550.1 cuticle protein, putative [Ixodes scapularis]